MIKFGPSGNSESFFAEGLIHTEQTAEYLAKRKLDCYEYSFGRGVRITEDKCYSIKNAFEKYGIEISAHAPYYVNFANPDEENAVKSVDYVLSSAKAINFMGGNRVVFHPASQGKADREAAVSLAEERLKKLAEYVYLSGFGNIKFCPETMGKLGQIGTIEEIVRFCKTDKIFYPCVDFGHVNARENGSLKTEKDFEERLSYILSELGAEKTNAMEIHFSKIEYTKKGEVKHLTFADEIYGPEFEPLSLALKKLDIKPYIICESAGTQAEDAIKMREIYEKN